MLMRPAVEAQSYCMRPFDYAIAPLRAEEFCG
jgi:hypothetical protein